jgi:4'-phosphopantetheinyl transferase EntD
MIERIVPATVAAEEAFEHVETAPLYPEEEALLVRVVPKRRREFTTARHCARIALARLGVPPAPIIPGQRGAPTWPAGVVGSMTHCAGYVAAALAHQHDIVTVGVDAEPHEPLPDGVLRMISIEPERPQLEHLAATAPDVHWDRLLFCAKEAVYKAWFPLAQRWLDFSGARITFNDDGTFDAELLVPGPQVGGRELTGFSGRWLVADGLMLTAITVPAGPP